MSQSKQCLHVSTSAFSSSSVPISTSLLRHSCCEYSYKWGSSCSPLALNSTLCLALSRCNICCTHSNKAAPCRQLHLRQSRQLLCHTEGLSGRRLSCREKLASVCQLPVAPAQLPECVCYFGLTRSCCIPSGDFTAGIAKSSSGPSSASNTLLDGVAGAIGPCRCRTIGSEVLVERVC